MHVIARGPAPPPRLVSPALLALLLAPGCGGDACGADACADGCGATEAAVARIIDGDTIELRGGERVRYLRIDTPETTGGASECFGANAVAFNTDLVLGKRVSLRHDVECRDAFGRTLAYVSVAGQEVNALMVERGFACVLHIPPNGDDRAAELRALEAAARGARHGLWGACDPVPCD